MINPEIFPVMDSINLAAPEDAQKLSVILNELFEEIGRLNGELEGQWEHIRNLENKLLNPLEVPNGQDC